MRPGTSLDGCAELIFERPAFSVGIAPQAHYNAFTLSSGAQKHGTSTGKITSTGSTTNDLRPGSTSATPRTSTPSLL